VRVAPFRGRLWLITGGASGVEPPPQRGDRRPNPDPPRRRHVSPGDNAAGAETKPARIGDARSDCVFSWKSESNPRAGPIRPRSVSFSRDVPRTGLPNWIDADRREDKRRTNRGICDSPRTKSSRQVLRASPIGRCKTGFPAPQRSRLRPLPLRDATAKAWTNTARIIDALI